MFFVIINKMTDISYCFLSSFVIINAQHFFMLIFSLYANYDYNPRCTLKVSEESQILSAEDLAKHLKETHEQLRQALASAQAKYKENFDVHVKDLSDFKIGDLVWLSRRYIKSKCPSQKLDVKRLGPFKILEIIDESNLPSS